MSYPIEIRPASKNGWHTPAEAKAYYGRYSRSGVTWHWWGDGGANGHDATVNYILGKAVAGTGSVNYVLSDSKITMLVEPRNVAWASQSGNPVSVSVELQTYLGAAGYKKAGWLKLHLEKTIGNGGTNWPHKYWFATQCPGTISIDRIQQEYNKWKTGQYDPAPAPTPTPPPSTTNLTWKKFDKPIIYTTTKSPTHLWNFNVTSWSDFKSVKDFPKGENVVIYGQCINNAVKATYLVTEYSFTKKITNGFNVADMTVYVAPTPKPQPAPVPTPTPVPPPDPTHPEWVQNLRDVDDTKYWFTKDTDLIDITTGKPTGTKTFKKDEEFVASAITSANKVEYRITEYSFSKKIYNGVPISNLTLTPPGEPDVDPIPDNPDIDKSVVRLFLESIVKAIQDFIAKFLR